MKLNSLPYSGIQFETTSRERSKNRKTDCPSRLPLLIPSVPLVSPASVNSSPSKVHLALLIHGTDLGFLLPGLLSKMHEGSWRARLFRFIACATDMYIVYATCKA